MIKIVLYNLQKKRPNRQPKLEYFFLDNLTAVSQTVRDGTNRTIQECDLSCRGAGPGRYPGIGSDMIAIAKHDLSCV